MGAAALSRLPVLSGLEPFARRVTGPARWKGKAAGVLATLVQVAAVFSLVLIYDVGGYDPFHRVVYAIYTVIGLPVDGSVVIALVLAVLGVALRRRKRAALNVMVLCQATEVVFLLSTLGWRLSGGRHFRPVPPDALSPQATPWLIGAVTAGAAAVLVLLLVLRPAFQARLAKGALRRVVVWGGGGLAATALVGWGLTFLFPGRLTGPGQRLEWSINQVIGRLATIRGLSVHGIGSATLSVVLGLISAVVVGCALLAFFASVRHARALRPGEELRLRELLAAHGEQDSLGYFATRRDKSVLFAPDGAAAVTYRVLGGISLASADPVGDKESWSGAVAAWLAECAYYGWVPAALGASEQGARCYRRAGLKALELGDEAVLDVGGFGLGGRNRRAVRQAANRLRRAGYSTRIRRHGDIPPAELTELADLADHWRGAGTERGFSMALSRLGDPADARCVMVEAFDASGTRRGLLSFVPWGRSGLSLDLMRRDATAPNGLNEYLVAELVDGAAALGVRRISLNFAMFRAVFASAERIGVGPVLRMWRGMLLFFSRFFQLESLYRSNIKYDPEWLPRFICYQRARHVPRVGVVAGMAEGFVPYWSPTRPHHAASESGEFLAAVRELDEQPAPPERWHPTGEQTRVRIAKLEKLRAEHVDPYPATFDRDCDLTEVRTRFGELPADTRTGCELAVAGRVVAKRALGGLCFLVLRDFGGELQVMLESSVLGARCQRAAVSAIDLGDHLGVRGEVVTSRRGELSVLARDYAITAKSLHPLPDARAGVDPELRVRRPYLDLMVRTEPREMLARRAAVNHAVREFLTGRGYLEVETPMLQNTHGGANARPFTSHINAYDQDVYLRIAPELYLKRLCVAGVDRLFELNRNFRNEGADATHNPEFTMLEAYQAYADYRTMLRLAEDLVRHAARAACGGEVVTREGAEYDLSGTWAKVGVYEAVAAALGHDLTPDTPMPVVRAACLRSEVPVDGDPTTGELVLRAYERLVEPNTVYPTFYLDFPVDVSPLTRAHRDDPRLAERWDLVAFGTELATAYSELTDPLEQRRRLAAQSLAAAGGDPEAMELDEDFLLALEHGMPPTGGLGMGIDRLLMTLTGATIRQTIPFPFTRAPR